MKKGTVFGIILIIAIAFLASSNPSEEAFAAYIEDSLSEELRSGNTLEQLAGVIAGKAANLDASANVRRDSYLVLSVFRYRGAFTQMQDEYFVGIANRFIRLGSDAE